MTFNISSRPAILSKLKEATRDQHDSLEQIVDVMGGVLTRSRYEKLLTDFYRFYSSIEPRIPADELTAIGFDPDARRKTPLLERDLKSLGIFEQAQASKAAFTDLPALDTVAKAFGSIYVMEGATLGGQVITRHLRDHLEITPENGGAFFNSYGSEVGTMWKKFCAALGSFAEENGHEDEIVGRRKRNFNSFARCITRSASARASKGS